MKHRESARIARCCWLALTLVVGLCLPGAATAQSCARNLQADVVALDQVFFWNRLGAVQPQGMMFALRRDVVSTSGGTTLTAGNVQLRPGKRPRPLVLRMNVGDCLQINFQNLLANTPVDREQPATRWASVHVVGMQLRTSILDDGSNVGANPSPSGLVLPGGQAIYTLYADKEGEHVLYSAGATTGGEGDGGSINSGLFGALIVEPAGSVWYRSQVTRADLDFATTGTTQYGQPILNYGARYPVGSPQAGQLIFGLLDGLTLVKSDLTAIIAGPLANGRFPAGTFPPNAAYPDRDQPFREFTIIYHDEIGAVQAFPQFEDEVLHHTLQSGRDGFAINYGTGGVGAEVLANRLGVGPMAGCAECKYEEFFLTSWALGDPAMVVDVPANAPCTVQNIRDTALPPAGVMGCTPTPGAKATKAFYPDDPSNVYHSYLRDHTTFRVLHGGSKEHHIHHLHAHQWEFSADSSESAYLDSQALGPGSSFTGEIAHEGSGNSNLTVGDSIFHCHFYPHFAQGMWSLWRVHDVFERGTVLGVDGRPAAGSRAYPDGEILAGTPIPAVVPLPGKPMAPMPEATVSIVGGQVQIAGTGNPGYPFFVPAKAGHRPPHPPLDTIDNGGLSRHIITSGTVNEAHTRLDFHKKLLTAVAQPIPETGSSVELAAMAYHALPSHPSCLPSGTCLSTTVFLTNGRPAVAGAPYADPCVGSGSGTPPVTRRYKAADIQTDVKLNKVGWHSPQQRFSSLWQDVASYLTPSSAPPKPPEPLFFRANTGDCIEYWLTDLVPNEYDLDDFQVRTPTDILGQHIHLVKFDVTSSDGAGNGWNYEDGTFSPQEVVERIDAIRTQNGCTKADSRNGTFPCPVARPHPFFGAGPNNAYLGAQTTVQRWYVDPVLDNQGVDRTLRTVFTHDHFGPSTHQQVGLYAGLVVEPNGSSWVHNETGVPFYTRDDGGPTSWQAVINPGGGNDYREFMLEFNDYQLAYTAGGTGFPDPVHVVNPPVRDEVGLPKLVQKAAACPGGVPLPCPEAISSLDVGTMSVNYRNEPIALRVHDPASTTGGQASGQPGDLAYAFSSNITRAETALNTQPNFYAPLTNQLLDKDPYTPLLRAYENDRVQIRILVGAHEEGHNFSIHGIKWLFEPSDTNSGWRNSQMMGISEHFEFIVPQLIKNPTGPYVDRLWSAGSSTDDYWNGIWGLLRSYSNTRPDLAALPSNPNGRSNIDPATVGAFDFSCPKAAPVRALDVTAVYGNKALSGPFYLKYNGRTDGPYGPLFDPYPILYFRTSDLGATGKLLAGVPIEPLVLRARAGECIQLTLRNGFSGNRSELDGYSTLPMIVEGFNANEIKPSNEVGLHPQLLYYDVSRFDGANIGTNAVQTVAIAGAPKTYQWYAGDVTINADGTVTATPIEFGATNLISADRIEHAAKGAFGALIIEPADATWTEDTTSRAAATVTSASAGTFREFVLMLQSDVNLRVATSTGTTSSDPVKNLAGAEDPEDSGQKAVNFRTEPFWKRLQYAPDTPLTTTRTFDFHNALSSSQVGADPQTPILTARAGTPVRIRLLQAGGHGRNEVFALHGHAWDKEPYTNGSSKLGFNLLSPWEGARKGVGPSDHVDLLLRNGAGGKFSVTGDYLFRDMNAFGQDGGLWGILRVLQ